MEQNWGAGWNAEHIKFKIQLEKFMKDLTLETLYLGV
jgi:hypothetical protein